MNEKKLSCVLTIAGFDSSAGAGIGADLKTFVVLGVYGTCVITSVTAQNTQGIQKIFHLPEELVASQIQSICQDIRIDAVKIGMLGNEEIVFAVCGELKKCGLPNIVVDPVLEAKDGTSLLDGEGLGRLKSDLLPLAKIVTPNLSEASAISGREVKDRDGMKEAASRIHSLGSEWVVVKGGHLEECATDILYNGAEFFEIESPRLNTKSQGVHGTGCTFSSAVAAELAKGSDVPTAVSKAKEFTARAIEHALRIGSGYPVASQFG